MSRIVDVLFDGPPSHEAPRFIEVESPPGTSVSFGEWVARGNGLWALRLTIPTQDEMTWQRLRAEVWSRFVLAAYTHVAVREERSPERAALIADSLLHLFDERFKKAKQG